MKTSAIVPLVMLVGHISSVQADTVVTVDQFLNSYLSVAQAQCSKRDDSLAQQYENQGKKAEAHSIRSAAKTVCSCGPERARLLQSILSKEEKATKLSEADFTKKYLPQIVNKCAADQLKSTYADGCTDRFGKLRSNPDSYCSCMSHRLNELSDTELAQLGNDSSDWAPRAAEAMKRGLPLPEQPPTLKRFASIDASCRKQ